MKEELLMMGFSEEDADKIIHWYNNNTAFVSTTYFLNFVRYLMNIKPKEKLENNDE